MAKRPQSRLLNRWSILDTSLLIYHWHRCAGTSLEKWKEVDAISWGQELTRLQATNGILTPIYLEMVCGVQSQHELRLTRAYLAQFHILDEGTILLEDWEQARRLAEWVPRDGKPRQLGDCLIAAIARRLRCEVQTRDRRFPGKP